MRTDTANTRSWAVLCARVVLGLMFFMAGTYKVFQMGAFEHARRLFVEPYADTFLPAWSLWVAGSIIPVIEFVAGALLILGLRTRESLIALGGVLMVVTLGHLLKDPFYEFHTHVIPRLVLLIFLLMLAGEHDRFSIDRFWSSRQSRG